MSPPPTFSPLPFVPLAPLDSIPSTPMSCAYTLVYCLQNLGAMMREAQQCWSSWGWLSSLSVKLFTSTLIFISWRSKKAMAFMTLKNLCCYIVCAIQYIYKFSKMLKSSVYCLEAWLACHDTCFFQSCASGSMFSRKETLLGLIISDSSCHSFEACSLSPAHLKGIWMNGDY